MKNNNTFIFDAVECKQCPNYPNYAVTKDSVVYRISSGKKMAQALRGVPAYMYTRISHNNIAKNVRVHIMVADAWLKKPSLLHDTVNHIDGNKLNNHVSNLEWTTKSQNQRHALETGLKQKGEDLYNASLTEADAHRACKMLFDGMRITDIANILGTSKDVIRKIRAGDTWFDVRVLYDINHNYKTTCSESTVRWVCERILEGMSDAKIAKASTCPSVTTIEVKRIRYGIRYKEITQEYLQ